MVLVLGLLALVVGYWVYQSKKAAQAAVRYQVHKDALEEARKVLNKYPHQKGADFDHEHGIELGVKYFFDLRNGKFPPDVRWGLRSPLEDLAFHVYDSRIPHDLGNRKLLSELLQSLALVRRLESEDIPPSEYRELLRRNTFNETVEFVEQQLSAATNERASSLSLDLRQRALRDLREVEADLDVVLSWYSTVKEDPGHKIAQDAARNLRRSVTTLLEDPQSVAALRVLDDEDDD